MTSQPNPQAVVHLTYAKTNLQDALAAAAEAHRSLAKTADEQIQALIDEAVEDVSKAGGDHQADLAPILGVTRQRSADWKASRTAATTSITQLVEALGAAINRIDKHLDA